MNGDAFIAKAQVNELLYQLSTAVNQLAQVKETLETVQGGIILLGLTTSSNHSVAGAATLAQVAKETHEALLQNAFDLRQRLTLFRDVL